MGSIGWQGGRETARAWPQQKPGKRSSETARHRKERKSVTLVSSIVHYNIRILNYIRNFIHTYYIHTYICMYAVIYILFTVKQTFCKHEMLC